MTAIDERDERIRQRAYDIWQREGCPDGRADTHWVQAKEELAIEDSYRETLRPNPSQGADDDEAIRTEPVEPLMSPQAQGEGIGPTTEEDAQPLPAQTPDLPLRTARPARRRAPVE